MDNEMKWFAIMMIGIAAAFALMTFADSGPTDYETCVKYHSPKECD